MGFARNLKNKEKPLIKSIWLIRGFCFREMTCALLARGLLLELAASGVDIRAAGLANGDFDAGALESDLEGVEPFVGGGMVRATLNLVELDEVHMTEGASREGDEGLQLSIGVVDACHQGIFIRGTTTGCLGIRGNGIV